MYIINLSKYIYEERERLYGGCVPNLYIFSLNDLYMLHIHMYLCIRSMQITAESISKLQVKIQF